MLVANSFDLWQKDIFFSAAEEVQASTDIMESAYRTWIKQRREGLTSIDLDELCRELQTALGTAKWQLDEFQRAVRTSYGNLVNNATTTRHEQFSSAIESQISRVEAALKEYFNEEVKRPLRWINLDEEERDDLAMFLSGVPGGSKSTKESDSKKDSMKKDDSKANYTTSCKDDVNSDANRSYLVEMEPIEVLGTSDGSSSRADKKASSRRTWGSQDIGITIDHDDDEQKKPLMLSIDSTSVRKPRCRNYWVNQFFRRAAGNQRQPHTLIHLQRGCSFRLTLVLMLMIFLLVPFVMYSE